MFDSTTQIRTTDKRGRATLSFVSFVFVLFFAGTLISVSLLPGQAAAQTPKADDFNPDPIGERDTLFLEINRIGDRNWSVNISYFSDIELFGLSIPLRFTSGLDKVMIDSTIFTGGKVDHFEYKMVRADTAIQCLTLGLIAAFNPNAKPLEAGTGRLATVFLHSPGKGVAPPLKADTTTTAPSTSLMFVKNSKPPVNEQVKIFPAVRISTNEAVAKKE